MPTGGATAVDDEHRVSLSDLNRKLSRYVHDIKDGPVTVTQRGEPVAVLVDFAEYRALLDMEDQAEDLYWTVVALRRSLEFIKSPKPLVSRVEVERRARDHD
nr:type II toxin-antitoxin system prevent-host-death family antitoxin [Sulfobacillus harzensis]